VDLRETTWLLIILAFLSFSIGSITVFWGRQSFNLSNSISTNNNEALTIFSDGGKTVKMIILITGTIGFIAALQNWVVLLNKYGSISNVLLSANEIYSLRVDSKLTGVLPYFSAFSLIGICLGGAYTAYKNKLTLIVLLPFVAAVLKSLAQFGRVGMLIAFVAFISSFFLYRNYIASRADRRNFSSKKIILVFLFFLILIISAASVVKIFRGTYEGFKGATKELAAFKEGVIISPSVYLYLSSHVAVLNQYLVKGVEEADFGENSLAPFYNLFSKFGLTERVPYDARGYFIPMWSNSGTYLREIHADYGVIGVFLLPYLLGLFSSYFWVRFYYYGKPSSFIILLFLYQIIILSFFSIITRGAEWFIALFFLLAIFPTIKRIALKNASEKSLTINPNFG
jgi:oligosaccharide repeat unit polymerase